MARPRSPAIVAWLTVAMVALIAYGSLYPFNLKPAATDLSWWHNLWQALTQLSWARAGRSDHIANVLLYVPLGFCLSLWLDGSLRHRSAVLMATLFGAVLSLSIEVAQVFISSRVASLWDVTLNTCGALCGAFGGVAWFSLSARLPTTEGGGGIGGDRAALIVLSLWIASRWAPFIPDFTLSRLKEAIQPLIDPQVTLLATIFYLVWWTVIAQTVFALSNAQRGVEMLLAVMAAVLVGRLFVANLAFAPSELIALVLLLPTLVLLHRLWSSSRRVLLLAAFAFVFVIERLVPPALSGAGHFDWWPFMSIGLHELFKALFEFAALAWLLRDAGFAARSIIWFLPLTVCALEIVALWMPGRDGSPTAPLLALATALVMRYVSEARTTHQRVHSH